MLSTQTVLVVSSSLFTGMISLTMMFLVIWQAPRQRTNQILALMLASLSSFGFLNAAARFIDELNLEPRMIFTLTSGLYIFSITLLYFFSQAFTQTMTRKLAWVAVAVWLVFIFGAATDSLFGEFKPLSTDVGGYAVSYKPLGLALVIAGAFYTLLISYQLRSNPDPRPQSLWKAAACIAFGVMMLILRPLSTLLPAPLDFLMVLPYNSLALGVAAMILGQAILHYQLFSPLQQLNLELQAANRAKDEFLATMSHELRTPFGSIIGFTELIKAGTYGEVTPEQDARLERVLVNARHVLSLINDILDLSKINAGQVELNPQPLDVAQMVEELMGILAPLAEKKGLKLDCELPPKLEMLADERFLRQILLNLLNNAIKFTPQGEVNLRVFCAAEQVCFAVQDTGIGIAAADIPKVFAEFQQVDGSYQREYGGTGLGMAISRKLAELQGGRIELESEVGRGSTFSLWLPHV